MNFPSEGSYTNLKLKIKEMLDLFEQQLYYNGYSAEKDIPLFNALEALRRNLE